MIDFLLVWRREKGSPQAPDDALDRLAILARYRPVTPTQSVLWQPTQSPNLKVYAWGHDVLPLDAAARICSDADGLTLFDGWALQGGSRAPVRDARAARLGMGDGALGEYLLLHADHEGNGYVRRNLLASAQLYQHVSDDLVILGTRPSMIAAHLGHCDPNKDFVRWTANYSIAMTDDSLFRDVRMVMPGSRIEIVSGQPRITPPEGDILYSEEAARRYLDDRDAYWDEVYDNLLTLLRVVDLVDTAIEFPISGGKDSRLLLGLLVAAGHRDRISGTYTNGPDFSPEVRAGQMVAEHLSLPHRFVWSGNRQGNQIEGIGTKLLRHLFLTEGEMSPSDLSPSMAPRRTFELTGQEAGLRNIAGSRDVSTREKLKQWMLVHLGRGDFCGIMTVAAREQCLADIEAYIQLCEASGTPYDQIPSLHRVTYRGSHWVSRVWGVRNTIGFSPQVFRSEVVTRATYNAGARSRQLEEFHFQMLRRIDPALLSIPFAGQTWNPELLAMLDQQMTPPDPLTWPEGFSVFAQRGMFGALKDNFAGFKSFIEDNAGDALQEVIDLDRLRSFAPEQVMMGHVQPLWQVFQSALLASTSDFASLRTASFEEFGLPDFNGGAT